MDNTSVVKKYFALLDAGELDEVVGCLSEKYQLVDFMAKPLDREGMLALVRTLREAMPNLKHSLSNISEDGGRVKLTMQRSGTHTGNMDLRELGIGIVPPTKKFIIFPNEIYEFTVVDGVIAQERNISAPSASRRMSGMLRSVGVSAAATQSRF